MRRNKKWFLKKVGKYILYKSIYNKNYESIKIQNSKMALHLFYSQNNLFSKYKKHYSENYKTK